DFGPEGGDGGGEVIAKGTPEDVVKEPRSYTGQFLKELLERRPGLSWEVRCLYQHHCYISHTTPA
ncbi:hypothetical protein I6F19_07695, partial [Ensifer sp. BRP08]|nr:hypothetical protein [Ensifer sp. BRP08]